MSVIEAVRSRRSIKKFTDREITREEIERLLDGAVLAPNHRLTNSWRFYVLGPESRHAYGLVLGGRKAKKIESPEAAQAMRDNVAREHRALPAMIAVAVVDNENPEIREEDYAAAMMAIQTLALLAADARLGTAIRTGAVMADPGARAAAGVRDNEKIVAIVNLGEPLEAPAPRERHPASGVTIWMP